MKSAQKPPRGVQLDADARRITEIVSLKMSVEIEIKALPVSCIDHLLLFRRRRAGKDYLPRSAGCRKSVLGARQGSGVFDDVTLLKMWTETSHAGDVKMASACKLLIRMVGPEGFEPPTKGL